jgi:hypothetical protein
VAAVMRQVVKLGGDIYLEIWKRTLNLGCHAGH